MVIARRGRWGVDGVSSGTQSRKSRRRLAKAVVEALEGRMYLSLLAAWHFNETSGTTAADASGNGYNATLHGTARFTAGRSGAGNALNLDGGGYADAGNPTGLNISGTTTLSAWIKPTSTSGVQEIIDHGTLGANAEVYLRIDNGYYEVGSYDGTSHQARYAISSSDLNHWVHLAGTYDGSTWQLYRDGAPVASSASAVGAVTATSDWVIGASSDGSGANAFTGQIDDARIDDTALNTAQIDQLAGLPAGWSDIDVGSPAMLGGASFDGTTWTVQGGGTVVGTSDPDQLNMACQSLSGDFTLVVHLSSMTHPSGTTKAGVMVRVDGTGLSNFMSLAYDGSGYRLNGRDDNGNWNNAGVGGYGMTWLKLVRVAGAITAYDSSDGVTWNQVEHSPRWIAPASSTVLVGMFVNAHKDTGLATATFTNVSLTGTTLTPLPSGWSDSDIGSPDLPGTAGMDGTTWVVGGSGVEIGNDGGSTADHCNFASQSVSGDTTILAKVTNLYGPSDTSRAGVMLRADNTATTAFSALVITPGAGIRFYWRDGNGNNHVDATDTYPTPTWLKLVRSSNTVSAYYSTDGSSWTQVGSTQTLSLPTTYRAGLMVNSHKAGQPAAATFTDMAVLVAPTLQATSGDGSATLDWSAPFGATSYDVFRTTTSGSGYARIATGITDISYTDTGLTDGTTYYYVVTALDACGDEGAYSSEVSATPQVAAPGNLTATAAYTQASLSWSGSLQAASYTVYRSTSSGGGYSQIASGITDTSYTDFGLIDGRTYYYVVTAVDAHGNESAYSAEVSATPQMEAPSNLTACADEGQIALSWDPVNNAAGYTVLKSTASGSGYVALNAQPVLYTSYVDTNVIDGCTYYYVVTAISPSREVSAYSNEVSAVPGIAAPSLTATPESGQVDLFWSAPIGAVSYNVYRSTTSGSDYEKLNAQPLSDMWNYVDAGLTDGQTYYYVVTAIDASGQESVYSSEISAMPWIAAPGVSATVQSGEVTLSWVSPLGAVAYNVYRSMTKGSGYELVNSSPLTDNSFSDTGLTNGTPYYYVVTALDLSGHESAYSCEVSAIPLVVPSPPDSIAVTTADSQVTLTWSASTLATSYNVYRSTGGGAYEQMNADPLDVLTYTDTNLTDGDTYTYVVTAVNSLGESEYSTPVTAVPWIVAPGNVAAQPGDEYVQLGWDSVLGAVSYNVYRSTTRGSGYTVVNTDPVLSTEFEDYGLTNETTYYYVVTAVNAAGQESVESTETAAMPRIAPPYDVTAQAGDGQVSLTWWSDSSSAVAYNVYRSTSSRSGYVLANASPITDISYTDTGLTNNTTYYYVITALDATGNESDDSSEVAVTPVPPPDVPEAPASVVARPDESQITLTWASVEIADSYNVYRSDTSGSGYGLVNPYPIWGTSYVDTGLTDGIPYYYVVTAVNTSGESDPSAEVAAVAAIAPPTNVQTSCGDGQINLTWSAPVGAAGYNIYRSTTSGSGYELLNAMPVGDTNYIDSGLNDGTTYYYVVTALNGNGQESACSAECSAVPWIAAPVVVSISAEAGQATLTWDGPSTAVAFNVYCSTTSGKGYQLVNPSPIVGANFTDTGLIDGTTYYYVVTALNAAGQESAYSWEFAATPYLSSPENVAAVPGDKSVALSWDATFGASGYNVYHWSAGGADFLLVNSEPITQTNFTDTAVTNGTTYDYAVSAVDAGGDESDFSEVVEVTPNIAAPNVDAVARIEHAELTVSPPADAVLINIYRSTTSGSGYSLIGSITTGSSSDYVYTDSGLTPGVNYYYVVTDKDSGGAESSYSAESMVTPSAPEVSMSAASDVIAGAPLTLNLSAQYFGTAASIQCWTIDWGDGTPGNPDIQVVSGSPNSVAHVYGYSATPYMISASVTDATGTYSANSAQVTTWLASPAVTINGDSFALAGATYALQLSATFPAADAGSDTVQSWTIDWGDGSAGNPDVETISGNPSSATHIYSSGNEQFRVQASAFDGSSSYEAQNLQVDTTFGDGGIATESNGLSIIDGVAVQTDGKIVAVGSGTDAAGDQIFGLTRFNADGSSDLSFGTGGVTLILIGNELSGTARGVCIQPDGKILVAGEMTDFDGNGHFALVRCNADGSLDTSFGNLGTAITPFSSAGAADAMALQADGSIVLAGEQTFPNGNSDFALVRYTSNGCLDTSFDTNGIVTSSIGTTSVAQSVLLTASGRILAVGISDGALAMAQYHSDGSLDTDFGIGGIVASSTATSASIVAAALNSNGQILVAETSEDLTDKPSWVLDRYNSDGILDAHLDSTTIVGNVISIAVQPDGQIVAAGNVLDPNNGSTDLAVGRFNIDGTPDATFGTNGMIIFQGQGDGSFNTIAFQPDGKVVVGGATSPSAQPVPMVVRFNPSNAVTVVAPPVAASDLGVAGATSSEIDLSWTDGSGGQDGFQIERSSGTSTDWTSLANILPGTTTYADSGLSPNTNYFYRIISTNGGYATTCSPIEATTCTVAPTDLAAVPLDTHILLSWTAPEGAVSFNVYRSTTSGYGYVRVNSAPIIGTTYDNTGLSNDNAYYYVVTAVNAGGESAQSLEATATPIAVPAAPTNLETIGGNAVAFITWATVTSATSYNLYRSTTTGGGYVRVNADPIDGTFYADCGLTNGTSYYYVATAVNGSGEGVASAESAPTTPSAGASGTAISVFTGQSLSSFEIGSFQYTGTLGPTATLEAQVDWADGTDSDATVVNEFSSTYAVLGNHSYSQPGIFAPVAEVLKVDGSSIAPVAFVAGFVQVEDASGTGQAQTSSAQQMKSAPADVSLSVNMDWETGDFTVTCTGELARSWQQSDGLSTDSGLSNSQTENDDGWETFTISETGSFDSTPTTIANVQFAVASYALAATESGQLRVIETAQDLNAYHVQTISGSYTSMSSKTYDDGTNSYSSSRYQSASLNVTDSGVLGSGPDSLANNDGRLFENAGELAWDRAVSGLVGTYLAIGTDQWSNSVYETGDYSSGTWERTQVTCSDELLAQQGGAAGESFQQQYSLSDQATTMSESGSSSGEYTFAHQDSASASFTGNAWNGPLRVRRGGWMDVQVSTDQVGDQSTGDFSAATQSSDQLYYTEAQLDGQLWSTEDTTASDDYTDSNSGNSYTGDFSISGTVVSMGSSVSDATNGPQTTHTNGQNTSTCTFTESTGLSADQLIIHATDGLTSTIVASGADGSQTTSSTDTLSPGISIDATVALTSGDYSATEIDGGTSTVFTTSNNQYQSSSCQEIDQPQLTIISAGNDIVGDYATTQIDTGSTSLTSWASNQSYSATSIDDHVANSTRTITGNYVSGSYLSQGIDQGVSTVISATTNQSLSTQTSQTDQANNTITTVGNDISGNYTTSEIDTGTSSQVSFNVHDSFSVHAIETIQANDSIISAGNNLTGSYSSTAVDGGTITIVSTARNQTVSSSSTETDQPDTTISSTGNALTGDFSTTEIDSGTSTLVSLQSNQNAKSLSSTSTNQDDTTTSHAGNSLTGSYTVIECSGGTSSVISTAINQSDTLTSTQTNQPSVSLATTGNSITGDYSTGELDSQTSTIVSADSNQNHTLISTEIDNSSETTGTTGNEITGDYTTSVQGNASTLVYSVGWDQSQNATSTSTATVMSVVGTQGNRISGQFTTSETDQGTSKLNENSINTISNATGASGQTGHNSSTLITAGNDILATYSTTEYHTDFTSSAFTSTDESVHTYTHGTDRDNGSSTRSGNSIDGDLTTSSFSHDISAVTVVTTNQTLQSNSTQSAEGFDTTSSTGNEVLGGYLTFENGSSSMETTATSTNQSLNSTTTELQSSSFDVSSGGNSVTGDYNSTRHSSSTDTVHTTTRNLGEVNDSIQNSVESATLCSSGNTASGSFNTNQNANRSTHVTGSDENRGVTQTTTQDSTGSATITSSGDQIAGDYSTTETDSSTVTLIAACINQGDNNNSTQTTSAATTVTTYGNSIAGNYTSTTTATSTDTTTATDINGPEQQYSTMTETVTSLLNTAGNSLTGNYTNSGSGTDTTKGNENGSAGARTFKSTTSGSSTSSSTGSGNSIQGTHATSENDSSSTTICRHDTNGAAYGGGGGWDTQTVISNSNTSMTKGVSDISGNYTNSGNGTLVQIINENGNIGGGYDFTSTENSSSGQSQTGNSITGDYQLNETNTDLLHSQRDVSGGAVVIQDTNSTATIGTGGSYVAGSYQTNETNTETVRTTETHVGLFTQTVHTISTLSQGGNSLTGDYVSSNIQKVTTQVHQIAFGGTLDEYTSIDEVISTSGNTIKGTQVSTTIAPLPDTTDYTDGAYHIKQITGSYTLTEFGDVNYIATETDDIRDGTSTRTENGKDEWSFHEIDANHTKDLGGRGLDSYTTSDYENEQTGDFRKVTSGRSTNGMGVPWYWNTYLQLIYPDGEESSVVSKYPFEYSYCTVEWGNEFSGTMYFSQSGETRYDQLRHNVPFINPGDPSNGGNGMVAFSPIGLPALINRPSIPGGMFFSPAGNDGPMVVGTGPGQTLNGFELTGDFWHDLPVKVGDVGGNFAVGVLQDLGIGTWSSPQSEAGAEARGEGAAVAGRVGGALRFVSGAFETIGGVALSSTGIGSLLGIPMAVHGLDELVHGAEDVYYGGHSASFTSQLIQSSGVSAQTAENVDAAISIIDMGGVAILGDLGFLGEVAAESEGTGIRINSSGIPNPMVEVTQTTPSELIADARTQFDSLRTDAPSRANFLRQFAATPEAQAYFTDAELADMQSGVVPRGWVVHHMQPLFRGGDNFFDNLILVPEEWHTDNFFDLHFYPEGKNPFGRN